MIVTHLLILAGCSSGSGQSDGRSLAATTTTVAESSLCATGGGCAIGDIGPGGGTVYYDAGSHQSWGRYLEAAPKSWNGESSDPLAEWGCEGISISGATGTAIGTGAMNTAAIVAICADSGSAARFADALTLGGQSDWFLPSIAELHWVYANLARKGVGGFSAAAYWSSSEGFNASVALRQLFDNGGQANASKNSGASIRPVRAFG